MTRNTLVTTIATALIATAVLLPRPAQAQGMGMIPTSLEIDVGAGFFWFAQKSENFKHNVDFNAKLNIHFTSIVGFEASFSYVPTVTLDEMERSSYVAPNFGVIFHLTKWTVVPFVYLGAGFSRFARLDKYKDNGGDLPRPREYEYNTKDVDFLVAAGGGVKVLFTDRFGMRVDGRYMLTHDKADRDPIITKDGGSWRSVNNFHHVEFTGSLFLLIGGKLDKDMDGDGIQDKEDACPEDPEDFDGFEDSDGCPDYDNDKDGILDVMDQCPLEPEDKDGFKDKDGCPDDDNDGDGIPDMSDRCPNDPEDVDQFEDSDGCPDPDNDGDGVPDTKDGCPTEPEDKDGWDDADGCPDIDNDGDTILDAEDACPNSAGKRRPSNMMKHGCPENDTDKDGILDEDDQCPNDPEDRDGFEDTDGCPDRDNDGDGIYDDQDRCPMEPEDKDGWEDSDGCPDIDNDGDGFLDDVDKCPNDKENRNGFEDDDGCPDELPEIVKKFTGVIPGIQFKLNSDELLASSFPILNEAADVLTEFTGIRMEIQGHASSDGDDTHNMVLSHKRSESVRRYLVNRGIDGTRLIAIGYGETVPIADNNTQEGRVMNRRVEFKIIQPEE